MRAGDSIFARGRLGGGVVQITGSQLIVCETEKYASEIVQICWLFMVVSYGSFKFMLSYLKGIKCFIELAKY